MGKENLKAMEETREVPVTVIENLANSFGWKVNIDVNGNNEFDVEFENWTDQGQDVVVDLTLPLGFTLKELARKLYDYWDSYDPDEEASLWIGSDGHGKNGAPYRLSDLLADMKEARKMIKHLYSRFRSKADMKKYSNMSIVPLEDK